MSIGHGKEAPFVRAAIRPGVVEVARTAGVAPSTVSNVFNRPNVVSAALSARVLAAAATLGYDGADPAGRNLRRGRTNAIGVVMRERLAYSFEDASTIQLMQGFSEAADLRQLALVIVPAPPEAGASSGPAVRHVAVDGLLVYSLVSDDPLLDAVRRRYLPTVVVDSPGPPDMAAHDDFEFVGIDEQQPANAAVAHLLALGHRRLGIISTRLTARSSPGFADLSAQLATTASVVKGRLRGARAAIDAAGLPWRDIPVVQCQISAVEDGRVATHLLLDHAPSTTAIFAFSDPLALGARIAATERDLRVPDDLSIVGFDDSAPASEGLTTVAQPLRDKGRIATERLLRMIDRTQVGGAEPLLPTAMVVRASTAVPRHRP